MISGWFLFGVPTLLWCGFALYVGYTGAQLDKLEHARKERERIHDQEIRFEQYWKERERERIRDEAIRYANN